MDGLVRKRNRSKWIFTLKQTDQFCNRKELDCCLEIFANEAVSLQVLPLNVTTPRSYVWNGRALATFLPRCEILAAGGFEPLPSWPVIKYITTELYCHREGFSSCYRGRSLVGYGRGSYLRFISRWTTQLCNQPRPVVQLGLVNR